MATTSVQLWERIHAAGLASPDDCRSWAIAIAKSSSSELLQDPNKLAQELIRLGKLSPFQANVLFDNLPIPIAIGSYRLTESLASTLGANWFQAIDVANPKAPLLNCYLLNEKDLLQTGIRDFPPSLGLAARQVAIAHPSLDRWIFAGIEKSSVVGFCEKLQGQPLSEVLAAAPLSWQASVAMIEQIASGIQKMHEAGLVHGCICSQSVWCLDASEFVIRRDPIFPPANPYSGNGNSILLSSRHLLFELAAPELTLPNAIPSVQSDLYALGCLWYQAIANEPHFGAASISTPQGWANAHLTKSMKPLPVSKLPAPLQRCLAYLLAKNPSSRFATATAAIKAIEFAVNESEKLALTDTVAKAIDSPPPIQKSSTQPLIKTEPSAQPIHKPALTIDKPEFLIKKEAAPKPPAELLKRSQNAPRAPTAASNSMHQLTELNSIQLEDGNVGKIEVSEVDRNKVLSKEPKKSIGKVAPSKGGKSKKKSKKNKPAWVLPSIFAGACLLFGVLITVLVRNGTKTVATQPGPSIADSNSIPVNQATVNSNVVAPSQDVRRVTSTTAKPADSVSEYFAVDADDGQLLWAPPFAGSSFSLELLPAGVEAVVFASGNLWHGRGGANSIVKWWSESQQVLVKELANTPLLGDDQIASVAIALYPSKNPGLPQAAFRVTYSQARTIESIVQGLSGFKLQSFDPKTTGSKGYWINSVPHNAISIVMDELQTDGKAMVKRVVIGPAELLSSLPELNGSPAPLSRQLETLLKTTDARSDLSILVAPSFLFGDGRELLSGLPKLQEALRASLDESMQAVVFSTSIERRWYMELRMLSSETRDIGKFASALKSRLFDLPDAFEKGLSGGVVLHPYWRAIGLRYPQMIRALNRYLRFGLEDGQVVANAYLPTDALSNIAIASWMALNDADFGTNSDLKIKPTTTTTTAKPKTKSIDEILESKVTIGFDQESLEAALQLIASEVSETVLSGSAIAMTIDGASFQKEGITRNQSIRSFRQNAVPLRTVLTDLVRRANPVTTVQSATERNQKVVWIVLEDPEHPGLKKIELTTRVNVETKKLTLPKEFVAE